MLEGKGGLVGLHIPMRIVPVSQSQCGLFSHFHLRGAAWCYLSTASPKPHGFAGALYPRCFARDSTVFKHVQQNVAVVLRVPGDNHSLPFRIFKKIPAGCRSRKKLICITSCVLHLVPVCWVLRRHSRATFLWIYSTSYLKHLSYELWTFRMLPQTHLYPVTPFDKLRFLRTMMLTVSSEIRYIWGNLIHSGRLPSFHHLTATQLHCLLGS